PPDDEIAKLIEQLGTDDTKVRFAAENRLFEIGVSALPQLEKAVNDKDPLRGQRSAVLIERIYDDALPGDYHDLPGFIYVPIKEFVRYGERVYRETEEVRARDPQNDQPYRFGTGFGPDRLATRQYLRIKVREGATKDQVKKIVAAMRKGRILN